MKNVKLVAILVFLSSLAYAQEVDYFFEELSNNYTELSNPVSLNDGLIWDDPGYEVSIGFDFKLFNTLVSDLTFEEGLGADLFSTDMNHAIWPATADIADRAYIETITGDNLGATGSLSPISYLLEGDEGNRIFKLEWKNVGFYEDYEKNYFMNFQLWLYEGSDMIEVHFGASDVSNFFFSQEYNLIGFFKGNSWEPTLTGYILVEVGDSYSFNYYDFEEEEEDDQAFSSVPENGTVFRFYPEYAIDVIELGTENINIYPNPTSDFLSIKNDKKVEMNYKIISIDGRTILQGKSSKQNMQIDLRSLDAGMYFFQQNTEGKSISFIKN